MSREVWSSEDETALKELRRRKARFIRDQKRQRKYTPRLVQEKQINKEKTT